jgi:superfamily II DNA/RNA helicase
LSDGLAFNPDAAPHARNLIRAYASTISTPPDESSSPTDFESLGLSDKVLSAVKSQSGWYTPTSIQTLAIPEIVSSDETSFWCQAPTGSGKTAAYALPLFQKLMGRPDSKGIASLVLCPTRELAVQIGHVFQRLSANIGGKKKWNIVTIHGGVPLDPQIVTLADCIRLGKTVDVLVATPGRIVDVLTYYDNDESGANEGALERRLLSALNSKGRRGSSLSLAQIEALKLDRDDDDGRKSMKGLLDGVQYLVLDEADKLLSRAFESEVDRCLDLLVARKGDGRVFQTLLFSATFPKQIEPRVDHILKVVGGSKAKPPVRISCSASDRVEEEEVSSSLKKRLDRSLPTTNLQQVGPASTIELRTFRLEQPKRTLALRKLLQDNPDWDRVLVFVGTRYASEHVARKLRRAGIESAELHGKLDQEARIRRLNSFAKGRTRVLLATDVASRGLDVAGLPAVVNYDLPRSTTDFIHRIGRTGRAGKKGTAVTFITPAAESHYDLIERRHLQQPVEREVLPGFEPDESRWQIESEASRISAPGTKHSNKGLAYDRMYGGIKGRRKSKKDRLREQAARDKAAKIKKEYTK